MNSESILLLGARRRVFLIRKMLEYCRRNDLNIRICSSDDNHLDPIAYVSDEFFILPPTSSPSFPDALFEAVEKESIKSIVIWNDHDMPELALLSERLSCMGVRYIGPNSRVVEICNNKQATAEFAKKIGVRVPKNLNYLHLQETDCPAIIKPVNGAGSVDVYRINDSCEASLFANRIHDPLCQEFVDGDEFTVDVFSGYDGQPFACVARKRLKVRGSESMIGRVVYDEELQEIAMDVASQLAQPGPINIQFIRQRVTGKVYLIEINARISGGLDLSIAAGVPFHKWLIQMSLSEAIDTTHSIKYGMTMTRYIESLFIEHAIGE